MSNTLATGSRREILAAVRRSGGRATVGDVVARTGRSADEVRARLRELLEIHRGHLAVTESGDLIYEFDPTLIRRDATSPLAAFARRAGAVLRGAFKVWTTAMLVVYLLVFVALLLAALFANQNREGGGRRGGWGGGGRHRHLPGGNLLFWYWIWGPRWRIGRPYYGHRWERSLPREDRVPLYKKVFAFLFGPDRPRLQEGARDREILAFIEARDGVVSVADLVEHTGLEREAAREEAARLLARYDGEAVPTPQGALAFAFPELLKSAGERRPSPRHSPAAWERLEAPLALTGNTTATDAAIAAVNGFNLLAGATAPLFIFPRLGLGGPLAWIGLVAVPVAYSALFFAIPAVRWFAVRRENRRRAARNLRRLILGLVFHDALERGRGVTLSEALAVASRHLGATASPGLVAQTLEGIAAEFEAEVVVGPNGEEVYRFPSLRDEMRQAAAARRALALGRVDLGRIVYSSADSPAEEAARERATFDRELAAAANDAELRGLAPPLERARFREDWETGALAD